MNSNNRKSIVIKDQFYSITSALIDGIWNIMLTNLDDLFIEKLTQSEIIERCEKLNPLLSIEDIDVDEIICELFNDIPKYAVGTPTTDEMKLQTVIEGGTFKFVIYLSRADDKEFRREVMKPITLYAVELQQKFYDLIQEIKRKDEEILEYKANGAKLIRKHIETKAFDVKSWVSDAFKEYGNWLSMHQPISNNQNVGLEKNITVQTGDGETIMDEDKKNAEYSLNKTIEPAHMEREIVESSNDSVKYKKKRISDDNS